MDINNKETIKRIRHDMKRIANALKMLMDELDALSVDIEECITKGVSDGVDIASL